jgi:hypothetical protein
MIQKSKNLLLLVLILSSLYSCSPLKRENYYGTYECRAEIGLRRLILNDSMFDFSYEAPLRNLKSKGTWSVNGRKIILNSYDIYRDNYLIVKEQPDEKNRRIVLIDSVDQPYEYIYVIINNNTVLKTNDKGEINLDLFSEEPINTIEVNSMYLVGDNNIYKTIDNQSSSFIIKMIPIDYEKKYFKKEVLKVRKGKINMDKDEYLKKS